jgi:hypothetical protein
MSLFPGSGKCRSSDACEARHPGARRPKSGPVRLNAKILPGHLTVPAREHQLPFFDFWTVDMQMKQLIPAPISPAEEFHAETEFPNDVARLVSAAQAKGYRVTPNDAAQLWCRYSESLCACWLSISPDDDDALVSCMLKYAVVVDVAAGGRPNLESDQKGHKMTMPDERALAIVRARELLMELSMHPETFDAQALAERANHVLRHYPDEGMIELIASETSWLDWPRRV